MKLWIEEKTKKPDKRVKESDKGGTSQRGRKVCIIFGQRKHLSISYNYNDKSTRTMTLYYSSLK